MIERCRSVEGEGPGCTATPRRPTRLRRALSRPAPATVAALVLLLSACGGSSTVSGPATAAASGAATSAGPESTTGALAGTGTANGGQPATGQGSAASPTVTGQLVAPTPTTPAAPAHPTLKVNSDGLTVASGVDLTPLPFGSPRDQVVTALSGILGGAGAPVSLGSDCGRRVDESIDWPGQVRVDFSRGSLIGWRLDRGSPITTDAGFGLGATRAQVESALAIAVSDSLHGVEFTSDSEGPLLNGLLSGPGPDATVTDLWAGPACALP